MSSVTAPVDAANAAPRALGLGVVVDYPDQGAAVTASAYDFCTDNGRLPLASCLICGGGQHRPLPGTVTYVVMRDGYYKIGRTVDLRSRLRVLAKGGTVVVPSDMDESKPLYLYLVYPGDVEHALHWDHRRAYVIGEWFSIARYTGRVAPA